MVSSSSTLRRLACVFFCLGSCFAWSQSQPVFPVLHYDPYAVASPLAMAEGDVNGDGITDTLYAAASGSPGSSTLTSAPRDASGATLPSIAAGTVPCTANSLLLADLNKDNRLDAIVTCTEDKLAVLAGNGDGTFQTALTFNITKAAKAAAADLNGDRYPEIVVATNTGTANSVFAILLNKGAGPLALAAPQVYSGFVNGAPWVSGSTQLSIIDLDDDGKLDIIAGGNPDQISGASALVFHGGGDGTVHIGTDSTDYVGNNFSFADFDGDGKTDVGRIVANLKPVLDTILISYPNATKNQTDTPILPGLVRIQAIDLNDDGHPDVVLTGSVTTILLNDGAANLSLAGSYATPGTFYTKRKNAAGTDLVFSTPRGFYTLHGDAQGKFDGLPAFPLSDQIATTDINQDGVTDIFASDQALTGTYVLFGRGDGSFVKYPGIVDGLESFPLAGDFNGDGLADDVEIYRNLPGSSNPNLQSLLRLVEGNGSGIFTPQPNSVPLGVKFATAAVPEDFDGDGKLDIAISYFDKTVSPGTAGMLLVRGNGDGTFVAPSAPFYSIASTTQATPLASDLDNDGDLDLVWQNIAFINDGAATFTPAPLSAAGTALAIGDLDGDHVPDVVLGNAIYSGNGDGTFQPAPLATIAIPSGATLISASIGDLNGDGHPDLVLQHMTDMAGFTVAYGDGAGDFTVDPNSYTTGSKTPVSASLVRLNNQATGHADRPDYLVAADGAIISLLNQKNPTPGALLQVPTQISLTPISPSPAPLEPTSLGVLLTGVSPTGTVTFTSSDGTVLGKVPVNNQLRPYLAYQFPREGSYTVTASYSGDGVNAPSVSAPLTVSVAKKTTSVRFFTNAGTSYYTGYNSSFTIYFSGGFNPTGQIAISSDGQTIGNVRADLSAASIGYRFPTAGSYVLTASYPGDASNLPATATFPITVVDGPDFSVTASPTTATVKAGETATYTVTLTSIRNYANTVVFSCRPACPSYSVFLGAGQTATAQFTLHTNPGGSGGAAPTLSYGPAAAALLLFGVTGRFRKRLPQWPRLGLFAVIFAAGLFSLSGCSSGSGSSNSTDSSAGSGQGTAYYVAITAADQSSGPQHNVNLTLIVK